MIPVIQEENEDGELLGFNLVATKLLGIVTAPVRNTLITKVPQVRLMMTGHMTLM